MTGNSRRPPLLRLQLLGIPSVTDRDGTIEQHVLQQSKRFGLLAYLALQGGLVPRDLVLANFWPLLGDHAARRALRQAFHFLRDALGPDAFISSKPSVGIRPECWWCDVTALEQAFRENKWGKVIGLYHGEFLSGFHVSQVDTEFEFWIEEKRRHLRECVHSALWKFADEEREAGHDQEAIDLLRKALALDMCDEVVLRHLLELLDERGDRAGAIEVYAHFATRLQADLEIEPAHETRTLIRTIRANRLESAEQGEEEGSYTELPRPITPLVGREKEIGIAASLVRLKDVRLVSLTGAGGIGKTRIAIEVAHQMVTEYEGVCYVALSSANQGFLVELAASLGLREDSRDPTARVHAHLSNRRVLLVLDNFETVLGEAGRLLEILRKSPGVKALVTSARPLRISGEHEVPIEGFKLPSGESLLGGQWPLNSEAAAYFLQCAKSIDPQFALSEDNAEAIIQICHAVDGIPLALELAASRLREIPIEELARRLEEGIALLGEEGSVRPERQRTMASAVWWTAKSLDLKEYELFLALSVLEAPFGLRTAEALFIRLFREGGGFLDTLGALTERGLMKRPFTVEGQSYIEMPAAIRAEARREVLKSDRADVSRRILIRYYAAWLRAGQRNFCDREEAAWLRRIDRESKSLHALIGWGLAHDTKGAAWLVSGLWYYWWSRGLGSQGYAIVKRLLQTGDQLGLGVRGRLLGAAGNLALQGNQDDGVTYLGEAVELFRATRNRARLGWALQSLGIALREKGELEEAATRLGEALKIGLEIGCDDRTGFCQQALGGIALLQNEFEKARALFEGSIRSAHRSRDQATAAWALAGLGDVVLAGGSVDEAREYYERAIARFEDLDQRIDLAWLTEKMASVSRLQGNDSQAITLEVRSLGLYREIGYSPGQLQVLVRIAEQNLDRRHTGKAIKILGGVSARMSSEGSKEPNLLKQYEETISKARACAKDKEFLTYWRLGNSLSNEELVDLAREYEPPVKLSKRAKR